MENDIIHILIVDDCPENIVALEAVLSSTHYRLVSASSGEEALRYVLKMEFAVILLDVQMPGLNGFETAKLIRVREKSKHVPIIFITALSQTEEHIMRGYEAGAIDYMFKPFSPVVLHSKVEGFVRMYLHRKELQRQKELVMKRTEELEKAYRRLERSEATARIIQETLIDALITIDERGQITAVNQAAYCIFGYEEELCGRNISELIPCFNGNGMHTVPIAKLMEADGKRQNRNLFPIELQMCKSMIGEDVIYVCSARDITERKRQYHLLERLVQERTAEIKESRERYKSLFEHHPDAVYSCDLDGRYISVNKKMLQLTGLSREELLHSPRSMLIQQSDEEKATHHFRLAAKGQSQKYEIRITHKAGRIIDVRVINIPIIVDERVIGVYGIVKDISLEKILWEQLYESEEKYRLLVEGSPEAIFVREVLNEEWMFINQTGLQMLGAKKRSEVIGKSLLDFVHPSYYNDAKQMIESLQNSEAIPKDVELKLVQLNGEIIDTEAKIIPFLYKGKPSLHIIVRDVTELKRSREFIQQSEKLAMTGELAAGIAHEIRNPLTSLRGFTQLLDYTSDSSQEYMNIMISEIDRINTIVSELLLLAKPNKIDYKNIVLDELLENVVTLMSAQANLHGVEIEIEYIVNGFISIQGLEAKLKQVFINILKNAIEATNDGGKVKVYVSKTGEYASLRFVDEGCGILSELLPKIGQPFYTTKEKGTGLGLMVCHSIVESHRGMMRIESKEGEGTSVEIILPLHLNKLES